MARWAGDDEGDTGQFPREESPVKRTTTSPRSTVAERPTSKSASHGRSGARRWEARAWLGTGGRRAIRAIALASILARADASNAKHPSHVRAREGANEPASESASAPSAHPYQCSNWLVVRAVIVNQYNQCGTHEQLLLASIRHASSPLEQQGRPPRPGQPMWSFRLKPRPSDLRAGR